MLPRTVRDSDQVLLQGSTLAVITHAPSGSTPYAVDIDTGATIAPRRIVGGYSGKPDVITVQELPLSAITG